MKSIELIRNVLRKDILAIAVPISLQSLFQASFSVIDQIMVGQLGTNNIAAIGLGSKFSFLFIVTLTAIGTAASIMIAQYYGKQDASGVNMAFNINVYLASIITVAFLIPSLFLSDQIISLYTTDALIIPMAALYLHIIALGYIPLLCTTMLSTMLRNTGKAKIPMVASIIAVCMNTVLNYILIFGKFGIPKFGLAGAAIATAVTRVMESSILFYCFLKSQKTTMFPVKWRCKFTFSLLKQTMIISSPIILNEFIWGLGDTLYGIIYGRIGTAEMAAMTLTNPIQSLSIGLFTGFSAAASIMVGNKLGKDETQEAYTAAQGFLRFGVLGSICFSGILVLFSGFYVNMFSVPNEIKHTTVLLLNIFAGVLFVKVSNMILGGGILRSGGKTKYSLFLDLFGTWGVGIPVGFLCAFVCKLPIYWVYFFISMEEVVRLIIGAALFKSKNWIHNITVNV